MARGPSIEWTVVPAEKQAECGGVAGRRSKRRHRCKWALIASGATCRRIPSGRSTSQPGVAVGAIVLARDRLGQGQHAAVELTDSRVRRFNGLDVLGEVLLSPLHGCWARATLGDLLIALEGGHLGLDATLPVLPAIAACNAGEVECCLTRMRRIPGICGDRLAELLGGGRIGGRACHRRGHPAAISRFGVVKGLKGTSGLKSRAGTRLASNGSTR